MTVVERQVVWLRVAATIRLATEDDLPKLEWYGRYRRFRNLYQQTYRQQVMGRRLILVADVGGFPVGQVFVSLESGLGPLSEEPHGYLYALRVMDPLQRLGLGSALMRAAEGYLRDRGYRRATIAAAKPNEVAQRLYARLGYRIVRDDPGRWQYVDHLGVTHTVEEPCWIMEKMLDGRS
jgi:ribosomal protein S18 acetylase RimI-like enzyme